MGTRTLTVDEDGDTDVTADGDTDSYCEWRSSLNLWKWRWCYRFADDTDRATAELASGDDDTFHFTAKRHWYQNRRWWHLSLLFSLHPPTNHAVLISRFTPLKKEIWSNVSRIRDPRYVTKIEEIPRPIPAFMVWLVHTQTSAAECRQGGPAWTWWLLTWIKWRIFQEKKECNGPIGIVFCPKQLERECGKCNKETYIRVFVIMNKVSFL